MLVAVASAPRASPLPTRPHKTWSFLGLPGCDTPPPEDLLRQFFHTQHGAANPYTADGQEEEDEESDLSSLQDDGFSSASSDEEVELEKPRRISIEAQLFPAPLPIPTLTLKSNRTPPPPPSQQPPPAAPPAAAVAPSSSALSAAAAASSSLMINSQRRRSSTSTNGDHHPHFLHPTIPIPVDHQLMRALAHRHHRRRSRRRQPSLVGQSTALTGPTQPLPHPARPSWQQLQQQQQRRRREFAHGVDNHYY
ncbi:udp-glucose dehydrogenase udp-mannac protein [Diplodia corticola]|uniref:Udp-glucose dehydrogenase udp-mannac protein n=1 Tax=Diplodia corticola TaxID=236234 RepID=A0A1J9R4L2_9PEZI|nr:udp-glucose dehydrogenase udp-mannac protein [Diplodia corticola]OJD35170.1 udp-glucose dehydrogenase udp-mannac protein [Diplodia corticola]